MYEKVLGPLDGSKQSECIIDHVRVIAKGCGMPKLVLLRVVEPYNAGLANYVGAPSARQVQEGDHRAAAEYLSYTADAVRSHCGGVETVVLEGNAAYEIVEYARKHDIDLIAMSTHGKSGIVRWAVGSITRHVMDHWHGPLLTVALRIIAQILIPHT